MHGSRRAQWRSTLFHFGLFLPVYYLPPFSFVFMHSQLGPRARVPKHQETTYWRMLRGDHSMVGNTVYITNNF